jgi:hypothetical protein
MPNYATIAVVDRVSDSNIAVWKISVSEDGADMSGAWVFQNQEFMSNFESLNCGLFIEIENALMDPRLISKITAQEIHLNDFLAEARADVELGLANYAKFVKESELKYAEYMSIEPGARKLIPKVQKKQLVPPEFKSWPIEFDLKLSNAYLEANGKAGLAKAEKDELSNVLAAARVIQLFIQMWQSDEAERKNRIYVNGESAEVTILPRSWLKFLA